MIDIIALAGHRSFGGLDDRIMARGILLHLRWQEDLVNVFQGDVRCLRVEEIDSCDETGLLQH